MIASLLTALALSQSYEDTAANLTRDERTALTQAINRLAAAAERLSPEPPKAEGAAAAAPPVDPWKGLAGLGLTFITGNTENLTLTANLGLDKRFGPWGVAFRAAGAYGIVNLAPPNTPDDRKTTARRAGLTVRGERSFGSGFASTFVQVGSEFDHVKNIESRSIGELGVGLNFFNLKEGDMERFFLKLDVGIRGGYETRVQYFPVRAAIDPYGAPILAPRGGLALRWSANKHVRFSEEFEAMPYLLAPDVGRLLLNSTTKMAAKITESVALTLGLLVAYDSKPPKPAMPPERVNTDVTLTAGVEAAF